jgi:hypothetical protein
MARRQNQNDSAVLLDPQPFVRRRRHWKEKWDATVDFVYSRDTNVDGETVQAGTVVDKTKFREPTLRRMWFNSLIQRQDPVG